MNHATSAEGRQRRYTKIKVRSKDEIISGGENISSLDVEDALHRHAAVMLAAVVAQPYAKGRGALRIGRAQTRG